MSSTASPAISAAAPATSRSSTPSSLPPPAAPPAAPEGHLAMFELRKDIFADERDDNLKEIGKGTQRQDMLGHVTGTSTYFDDHKLQGMLHLKVVRSTHAHARLRRIDTTDA